MKQLREKGSKIQFMGADGSKDTTFLAAKAAVEGSYLTCPCVDPNISTDPAAVKFVADYKAKYNVKPGIYGGEGFDAVNLIASAIKAAGAPGSDIKAYRAKVAANLASTCLCPGPWHASQAIPNSPARVSIVRVSLLMRGSIPVA